MHQPRWCSAYFLWIGLDLMHQPRGEIQIVINRLKFCDGLRFRHKIMWPNFWPPDTRLEHIPTDFLTEVVHHNRVLWPFSDRNTSFGKKIVMDYCNWIWDGSNSCDWFSDKCVSQKKISLWYTTWIATEFFQPISPEIHFSLEIQSENRSHFL